MRFAKLAATAVTMLAFASAAEAQSAQRYSIQLSGIHVTPMGEAYEGLKAGPGFEAQFRITPGVWSFGFGLQGSSHDFDIEELSGETVTLAGVFFEPRRVIDIGSSRVAPYLSARLSYLQQSADVSFEGTAVTVSASGSQINGGGGFLIRMSPRVNLDLGATYGLIRFSDAEVEIEGVGTTTVTGTSGNGSNLVLRLGLAIGF